MIATLKFAELVAAVLSLITRMRDVNTELMRQVAHLRRKRPRSETLKRLERQLVLPFVVAAAASAPEPRAIRRSGRRERAEVVVVAPAPAYLRRFEHLNPVPPELRISPCCGVETTVSHELCETLDVEPAKFIVVVTKTETVACPKDDAIVSAPPPPQIVERGKLGDRLIIEALADKYIEHQPIEPQCRRFAYSGVRDRAPDARPRRRRRARSPHAIAELIHAQTRGPGLLATDATGIPVLDPSQPTGIRTGAIWCWTNARWVSFFYSPSADSDSVRGFLGDELRRTVQCDGTAVTSFLERAGGKRPGFRSHGRTRLIDCARRGDVVAREGLHLISLLFAIERASCQEGDNAEQRRHRRVAQSKPVLDELRAWLDEHRAVTPPKTPLGRALGYVHRQWHRLCLFLDYGNIELTNNRRERELRRLALGRRNWLFTWLDHGAERTGAIFTIVGT
jgi:transposase